MTSRFLARIKGLRGSASETSSVHSGLSQGSTTSFLSKQTASETITNCSPRQTKVKFRLDEEYDIYKDVFVYEVEEPCGEESSQERRPAETVNESGLPNQRHIDADAFIESDEELVEDLRKAFRLCSSSTTLDDSQTADLVDFMVRWSNSTGRGLEASLLNPERHRKIKEHSKGILQLQSDCRKGALKGQTDTAKVLRKRSKRLSQTQSIFSFLIATGDSMCQKEFEI